METIDMTPTWVEWTRMLRTLIQSGQKEAVKHLLPDLETMAKSADERNDLIKKHRVSMDFNPGQPGSPWTKIVTHPVKQSGDEVRKASKNEKPDYWSCYTVTVDGLEYCIADFPTEKQAVEFALTLIVLVSNYRTVLDCLKIVDTIVESIPEILDPNKPVNGGDAVDTLATVRKEIAAVWNRNH